MDEASTITLEHGDGGAVTLRFIRNEILARFGNPVLNLLEDGSWIRLGNHPVVVSTDSYIVDPPLFPGGDIGKLAVSGTVNDLLASGAIPTHLTFSLIVSEGFAVSTLDCILDSVQQTAQSVGLQIIAGDTKVLDKQAKPSIYINTTGLGFPVHVDKDYAVSRACVGGQVIVTGSVGDHGLTILSEREGLGFEQRVRSDCAPLQELILPLIRSFEGVQCLRDPTRGGLIGTLVDIAEASTVDILVDRTTIPVKKEVLFGCEMLGLDPLSLANEGKMVIVAAAHEANQVLAQLRQHPLGKDSAIIGVIQPAPSTQGRLILRRGRSKQVVHRPEGQPLPRLC